MNGKVVLIGAGPGDPLLLTIRGREYISGADCIVYDRLANSELLAYAKKDCELIYVGKENHHHTMKQEDINELLAEKSSQYDLVVRLKGGDPYVFGRGGEEALFLNNRGIEIEVVPGISSVIATLGDAGIPITHRGLSKGFQVVTAHSRKDEPADINYKEMLEDDITYLFLMGLSHVGEIAYGLISAGKKSDTPVAVISNGTTARQKKVIGTLDNIASRVDVAGLVSPAIIVVGKVVDLAGELNFFEKRPLFGKKYIVPFIERFCFSYQQGIIPAKKNDHFDSELESGLRELGADILSVKVGAIKPIEIADDDLTFALKSDYILFTSQNGVNAFLWNLKENGLDIRSIGRARIAVVGKKTAETLLASSIKADIIPERQTGRGLAEAIIDDALQFKSDDVGVRISFFGAKESNDELDLLLKDRFDFQKIVCYENKEEYDANIVGGDVSWEAYDGIFFTSGSTVKRMKKVTGNTYPREIFSIGPMCSRVVEKEIARDYLQATTSSYQGLIELVNPN